jgi:multidrug resistance efflux pump
MKIKTPALFLIVFFSLLFSACSALKSDSAEAGLTASGFIAADTIRIASEIGGKVTSIAVAEGDSLQAGDVLFSLDDEVLLAQIKQAQAAVDLANTTLDAANAQLVTTQAQYDVAAQQARLADQQNRASAWTTTSLQVSDLPVWYYQKSELLTAVEAEVEVANHELEAEQANLDHELKNASNGDFVAAENRLAQAQAAYTSSDRTLEQAKAANENTALVSAAQEQLDADKAELDAAKLEYDRMLTSSAADAVLEARARLSVARARRDQAMDMLTALQTGDDMLQLKAAAAAVSQAETAVAQAKANQAQAQAALELVQLQQPRMVIKAPVKGVVLSLNTKAGELVSAGAVALTLGQLDEVNLTVYVPEDQYGQISLGQSVSLTVDSIPDRKFSGTVQYISDVAEFTPRNVQTSEGRQSTVYAVKIRVPNPDQALKPGMPADVEFIRP